VRREDLAARYNGRPRRARVPLAVVRQGERRPWIYTAAARVPRFPDASLRHGERQAPRCLLRLRAREADEGDGAPEAEIDGMLRLRQTSPGARPVPRISSTAALRADLDYVLGLYLDDHSLFAGPPPGVFVLPDVFHRQPVDVLL